MCKLPGNVTTSLSLSFILSPSLSYSVSLSFSVPSFCAPQHHYHCDYHQHLLQSHSVKVNALFYASSLITATACLSQCPPLLLPFFPLLSMHLSIHKVSPELNAFLLYENYLAHFALIAALINFHIVYIRSSWQLIAASWKDKPINIMRYIYYKIW